jgi:hypothetical protein
MLEENMSNILAEFAVNYDFRNFSLSISTFFISFREIIVPFTVMDVKLHFNKIIELIL